MNIKITLFKHLAFLTVMPYICELTFCQDVNNLKLKDYRPVSIYKIPVTIIPKAKYPVIDFHTLDYPQSDSLVDNWVKTMDETGIEKSIILSCATGAKFDSLVVKYGRYKNRFDVWCGFDYTGYDKPEWGQHAIEELQRCYKMGARGVGELCDKGLGEFYSKPVPGWGLHIDDPQMQPLLKKCGELQMPVSIHVAEDEWMYLDADSANDGLMNAAKWKIDLTQKGILNHEQLVASLENAVKNNPKTTFIACHFANCCSNLGIIGRLLDTYPNLYTDIAARFGEISPIPRYVHNFIEKYQDRVLYGSDMGTDKEMYKITFRILETADEHFYEQRFNYHWPLYGLSLSDKVLRKIYRDNARKLLNVNR